MSKRSGKVHHMDKVDQKGSSETWACRVCGHQVKYTPRTTTSPPKTEQQYPAENGVHHSIDPGNPHPKKAEGHETWDDGGASTQAWDESGW